MRLLLVIPNVVSYGFLRELCFALIADGIEVHLACSRARLLGKAAPVEDDGVRLHEIEFPRGMNPRRHLRAARALDRLVETLRPDLVHAHFSAAIFTTALARTPRWPTTVATFHGVSFLASEGWKTVILRLVETWAARQFDRVWVLTDDDRDRLRAIARESRVETLSSCGVGCNLARFSPPSSTCREARRAELGFPPGTCVFAYVGRFVDFKGFALTVRAFFRLTASDRNARLLLIGARDPLHSTGLTAAEEQALERSPQVTFTGYRDDVPHYLAAADVLVFPSRREGMPVCLMEALAIGLPVITRDARGCRDVVRHEVDGIVLRECSVETLHRAMARLTNDGALRQRMAAQAVAGRERFSRRHFIREQKHLLAQLVPAVELMPATL